MRGFCIWLLVACRCCFSGECRVVVGFQRRKREEAGRRNAGADLAFTSSDRARARSVFMRISYSCPQHLKFSLTIERMTSLIRWSRESIAW